MPLFADPNAFHRHFHLVNRVDLETVLQAAVFINDEDGQVRAVHKILGYDPIQKSFADPKHVISANNPRLPKITVVENRFLIFEGSLVPEGIPLAGSSPSHQAAEDEGDLGLFEEGFGACVCVYIYHVHEFLFMKSLRDRKSLLDYSDFWKPRIVSANHVLWVGK